MEVWWVSTREAPLERLGSHRRQQFFFSPVSPWGWRHDFWGAWLNGVLSSRTPNVKKDSVSPKELRSKAATIQQLGQLSAFLCTQVRDGRKLSETLQTELASSMLAQRPRAMSCSSSETRALNSSLLSLMLQVFGPSFQDESYLLYSPALISSPNFQPSDKKTSTIGVHLLSSQILSLHETSQCFLRIVLWMSKGYHPGSLSVAVISTTTKNNSGEERLYLTYTCMAERIRGRNWNWSRGGNHGGMRLLPTLLAFLYSPWLPARGGITHGGLGSPQLLIKKMPNSLTYMPICWGIFSTVVPLSQMTLVLVK